MRLIRYNPIILILAAIMSPVFAPVLAGESSSAATGDGEMLKPGNMSRDDGNLLREYSARYNNCLTNTSIKQMETVDDPRRVVDHAMKTCAVELEELDQKMMDRNFDPNFRKGYIRSVSNRSANKILRTVMMGMATRQNQPERDVE